MHGRLVTGIDRTISSTCAATFLAAALIACAGLLVLPGCGSGDHDEASPPWSGVTIEQPSAEQTWTTSAASTQLAGRAFVPDGSRCDAAIGTVAPGYSVTWRNAATGASGPANVQLHCLLQVNLTWDTYPISLALGANVISVTATAADGRAGSNMLTITRVDAGSP
jgi:hypothetical protein